MRCMNKPRLKQCRACGEQFKSFNSLANACGIDCALVLGREAAAKKAKAAFRATDTVHLKALAQKAFNLYIRLRDEGEGCISCDKTKCWPGQWHAGHYLTTGARPQLRFNELNVWRQCSQCNLYLSGNLAQYRLKLTRRIGAEAVEALEADTSGARFRAEDYSRVITECRLKIKQLKSKHAPSGSG